MVSGHELREDQLRRAERLAVVGVLAARVAHDVRNPLFAISATLDAFEARFGAPPELERYLATLREQADRLEQLMKDLVECAPPPAPDLGAENPFALVERAVRCRAPAATDGGVELRNRVPRDLPPVPADATQLGMALELVIENAIHRSPPRTAVEIEARPEREDDRDLLRIVIRDAGPPIPEGVGSRLFDPLFAGPGGEDGLGLSIARRVLESHRGDIRMCNDTGGGAMAVLRLPCEGS